MIYIVLIYWGVINIVTFFLFGIDKWKAKRSKWRIEESTLLWWAAFGGSIGALRDVFAFQSNYDEMMRTLYPRRR